MRKHVIEDAAFNITNTCNLTCDGCESFNNYNFRGHVKFADYADYYTKWSELVDIEIVTVHGGEPFTNPDIMTWVLELKKLWPDAEEHYVATNGTLLGTKADLARQIIDTGYYLNICVHDPAMYDEIKHNLHEIIKDRKYKTVKVDEGIEYYDRKTRQRLAVLETTYYFIKNAIDHIQDKTWYLHHSNINDAYQLCIGEDEPCNFFHKGKLYQCHLTALKDDLFLQFSIEPRAVDLLKQYRAGDPFSTKQELDAFFANHNRPIPQCTLCPGCDDTHPIFPMATKKIKF